MKPKFQINNKIFEISGASSIRSDKLVSNDSDESSSVSESDDDSSGNSQSSSHSYRFDELLHMQHNKKGIYTRKIDNKK